MAAGMYFWAHHLLDVLSGGLLGLIISFCVLHFGTLAHKARVMRLGWDSQMHVLLSFLLFLLSLLLMQRRTRIFDQP